MYSWELESFIKNRNFYLGGDDLAFAIDINKHPQISYIKYYPNNKTYQICTSDGYCFYFNAMPIEVAKQKGLIKTLSK